MWRFMQRLRGGQRVPTVQAGGSSAAAAQGASAFREFCRLPRHTFIVFALDFLISYRSVGFRAVQFNFVVNEYGFSDEQAGEYAETNLHFPGADTP